jgi:hypothetical protein
MAMTIPALTPEQVSRIVEQGSWLLKIFHEEFQKDAHSRETEFWRGQFVGLRSAIASLYGKEAHGQVLDRIRQSSGLPIPHSGLLTPEGGYLGMDTEAGL